MFGQSVSSSKECTSVIFISLQAGSLNTYTRITNIAVDIADGVRDSTYHGLSSPILFSMTLWTEEFNKSKQ
jgi:hypothetical protein